MELGIVELAVVAEELGYALAPSPLAAHWAAKLLHPALEGRGTVAMWDADGGADPECADAAARTAADRREDRRPVRRRRRHAVVTADGGRHFAVAASDATIEPARALDTTRPLFTVRFDGASGEELTGDHFGRAWHAIAVAAAAESVGVAARVTQMTVEYAKERKQFGRPIGSYQAVSHACAQMFLETEGARNVVLWAAWALDHDPDTAFMAANCAKAYASDAAVNVCRSRCRSTAASASPGSTTCTCSSSAPRPTPTRSATPAGTASRSPPRCSNRQEALDGARLVASSTVRPGAAVGQRDRAGRLEHGRLGGAGGQLGADEAEQGRAGHVGADRLRGGPGDPGQPDEGLHAT